MTDLVTILARRPVRRRRQLLATAPSSRPWQAFELAALASCFATALAVALLPAGLTWHGVSVDFALATLGAILAVPAILGCARDRGQ